MRRLTAPPRGFVLEFVQTRTTFVFRMDRGTILDSSFFLQLVLKKIFSTRGNLIYKIYKIGIKSRESFNLLTIGFTYFSFFLFFLFYSTLNVTFLEYQTGKISIFFFIRDYNWNYEFYITNIILLDNKLINCDFW